MTPKLFAQFLDIENEGAFEFLMDPLWPIIEPPLRLLNGTTHSLVCIEGPPPAHMNIGGGDKNRYVVSLTRDGQSYFVLQNPTSPGSTELVELTVGGRTSLYPTAMLVPLDMVLIAAKMFAETGLAAPTLPWLGSQDIPQPNAESVTVTSET
jgi:hypothetical protein